MRLTFLAGALEWLFTVVVIIVMSDIMIKVMVRGWRGGGVGGNSSGEADVDSGGAVEGGSGGCSSYF